VRPVACIPIIQLIPRLHTIQHVVNYYADLWFLWKGRAAMYPEILLKSRLRGWHGRFDDGYGAAARGATRGRRETHRTARPRVPFVRVVMAVGCVLISATAGCSRSSPQSAPSTSASASAVAPPPETSAVQDESIPGIGATRAAWNAAHTLNAANGNGSVYGHDPSLPSYLSGNGAVYTDVYDQGTGRIQTFALNMHTVEGAEVLRRVRQELPSDAKVAWDLMLGQCYQVAFNSAALEAAGHYMPVVRLEYIQEDGTKARSPDRFNVALFWLEGAGAPPNPDGHC
jgi:hypothetical protein